MGRSAIGNKYGWQCNLEIREVFPNVTQIYFAPVLTEHAWKR